MIIEARTQAQTFEDYKRTDAHLSTWKDWILSNWSVQVKAYESLGWWMIPLGRRSKKPQAGFSWNAESLNAKEALDHAAHDGNIGVVAGPSRLVILDYDKKEIPNKLLNVETIKAITPRGYQFFTEEPFDGKKYETLKLAYPGLDSSPRVDIMYAVVPLSITCTGEKGSSHICQKHDYRIREWQSFNTLLSFEELVSVVL